MLAGPRFFGLRHGLSERRGRRMTALRIGIDLGGTKIEAAALDDRGALHLRQRVPTPVGDYAGTIAAIAALVARIEYEIGPGASVGIAIPGTIVAATGLVKNANSVWLTGQPLGRDVETALGRRVRFAKDANCLAPSEAAAGAPAPPRPGLWGHARTRVGRA